MAKGLITALCEFYAEMLERKREAMNEKQTSPWVSCPDNEWRKIHLKICQRNCAKYYRCEYREKAEYDLMLAGKQYMFWEEETCQGAEDAGSSLSL